MTRAIAPLLILLVSLALAHAGSDASAQEQARLAAIAMFTAQQEAMNWPEKFQRIGNEMGVPPDILAAVAFTETRWEQLTWPPGETASPETGAPRPFGVMSLWDNDIMGHSLTDAATLLDATPAALMADPELNIRGAAALLKKYYDSNPIPDGTSAGDIESWQNAIVQYSGLQDPWLAYHHTVNCYIAMNQGYDQYGMHWKPHPVNLAPMRAKLSRLLAAHDGIVPTPAPEPIIPPAAAEKATAPPTPIVGIPKPTPQIPLTPPVREATHMPPKPPFRIIWIFLTAIAAFIALLATRPRRGGG